MTKSKMANRYSPDVRARAVRMVFKHQGIRNAGGRDSGHCTEDRLYSPGIFNVASVIDTFADRTVGWRVSRSTTDFVLNALEQALHDRRPVQKGGMIHHSDCGEKYLFFRYTERLAEAGIASSVGSVWDS